MPVERQRNGQTAPGEHPAPSPGGGSGSTALAGLAPPAPEAGVYPPAPPTPGHPDEASSASSPDRLPSDDLSGPAGAFPLVVG